MTSPSLRSMCFYYRVTGEDAERLLNDYGEEGDFLARYSESQPTNFSLSIKRNGGVLHIKIQKTGEPQKEAMSVFGGSEGTDVFQSLIELVEFYVEYPEKLKEKNGGFVELRKPVYIPYEKEKCAIEQRVVQMNRWFHGNMTAPDANALLEKERAGTFLIRCSQHYPGALVISAKAETSVVHLNIRQDHNTGNYTIDGDNTEYNDIRQLLSTYRWVPLDDERYVRSECARGESKNPIVEKASSSRVVYLEHPLTTAATFCPADIMIDRYEILKAPLDMMNSQRTGIVEEFERLQAEQGPAEQYFSKREGRREINVDKNRYKNIVPFDHTRVVLQAKEGGSDYINASYIKFERLRPPLTLAPTRQYIATQGCMDSTVADFWRMIWQQKSYVIVMPTRENERREKCSRYWPELRESVTYDEITITTVKEKSFMKEVPEEFKNPEHEDDEEVSYIERIFRITRLGQSREIHHLQFVSWPDHGVPFHPHEVITFLHAVDSAHTKVEKTCDQGPVVVHCSAGIGRTGTFIILDVLLTQIKKLGRGCTLDIYRTARHARDYRGGLVQTDQQYGFLYGAVSYYIRKTNKYPELRLYERSRSSSSLLPMAPSPPLSALRMPDPAQAYIGPSPSPSPRSDSALSRPRSRTSPKTSSNQAPPLPPGKRKS